MHLLGYHMKKATYLAPQKIRSKNGPARHLVHSGARVRLAPDFMQHQYVWGSWVARLIILPKRNQPCSSSIERQLRIACLGKYLFPALLGIPAIECS